MNSRNERRTRNTLKLLGWLKTFHPEMHAAVIERVGEAPPAGGLAALSAAWDMLYPSNYYTGAGYRGRWSTGEYGNGRYLSGLGQNGLPDDTTNVAADNWWSDAITGIKEAGVAYLQWDAQKDIINLQTELIKQGREPIDTALVAPTVRHQVDIPPEYAQQIKVMGQGVMTWVLLGGAALAAFFMLRR